MVEWKEYLLDVKLGQLKAVKLVMMRVERKEALKADWMACLMVDLWGSLKVKKMVVWLGLSLVAW